MSAQAFYRKFMSPVLKKRGAAALIIVLAFLVLIAGLILAFFSGATTELSSANSYSNGASARSLADVPVQIVQAQIMAATASRDSSNNPRLWASQPGMIRTWTASGTSALYKLYSSTQMEVPAGAAFSMSSEAPPRDWASKPAEYVDLNAPVVVPDPKGTIAVAGTTCRASYPIMDPAAVGLVDGFSLNTSGSFPGTYTFTYPPDPTYNPASTTGPSAHGNPAPMPVQWMYMLADGTLTTGTGANGITSFSTPPTPSNPITARVAFWADDETAKINVNTASEGTYWDTPRDQTATSWSFERSIPTANEFQRSPGHPAGVCLSTVLGGGTNSPLLPRNNAYMLSPSATGGWVNFDVTASPHPIFSWNNATSISPLLPAYTELKPYYNLNPRVNYLTHDPTNPSTSGSTESTSRAGTQWDADGNNTENNQPAYNNYYPPQNQPMPVMLKSSRLYDSVDEFYFSDSYSTSGSNTTRVPNTLSTNGTFDASTDVSRFRFFLTANGRADETTPFNTPRVSVWPTAADTTLRGTKDDLLTQAASVGLSGTTPIPYYFTRQNESNLKNSTAGGASQGSGSSTMDYTGRNITLYNYLQSLTDSGVFGAIPGFGPGGGNFTDKWTTSGRDAVLTEAFDLIRAGVNVDPFSSNANVLPVNSGSNTINPQASFLSPGTVNGENAYTSGYVIPIQIKTTRGFGRFMTFTEMALDFYRYDDPTDTNPPPKRQLMQVIAYLQPYNPTPSEAACTGCQVQLLIPNLQVTLSGTGGSSTMSVAIPPEGATTPVRFACGNDNSSLPASFLPYTSLLYYTIGTSLPAATYPRSLGTGDKDRQYSFFSDPINVTNYTTFQISGTASATLQVQEPVNGTTLQTIKMTVPASGTMPLPDRTVGWSSVFTSAAQGDKQDGSSGYSVWRRAQIDTAGGSLLPIAQGDIVRSIVFSATNAQTGGDLRLLMLQQNVPAAWFTPHPRYYDSTSTGVPTNMQAAQVTVGASGTTYMPGQYPSGRYADSLRSDLMQVSAGGDKQSACAAFPYGGSHNPCPNGGGQNGTYFNGYNYVWPGSSIDCCNPGDWTADGGKLSSANTVGYITPANDVDINVAPPGGLAPGVTLAERATPVEPISAPVNPPSTTPATGWSPQIPSSGAPITGDWGSGLGCFPDGATLNTLDYPAIGNNHWGGYEGGLGLDWGGIFEPSRLIPDAVVFGGLLTANASGNLQGWQTLLFNPVPAGDVKDYGAGFGNNAHYGAQKVPDYLFLDFFWMPVVEPFALSESTATEGRINPNYQIAPFTYIHRATGLLAAMKSIMLPATPSNTALYPTSGNSFQQADQGSNDPADPSSVKAIDYKRNQIDLDNNVQPPFVMDVKVYFALNTSSTNGTIKVFEDFFSNGDRILRTASEVCSLPLIPLGTNITESGPPYSTLTSFWNDHQLTSDTLRETPYKHLYERLSTKSDTYTVHYRVQSLKQSAASAKAGQWVAGKDTVLSEYRGSTTIERYLDPSDTGIPDYATLGASAEPLSDFYHFRTLSSRQFIP